MSSNPTFRLLVRPLPSEFDPSGYQRLKHLLKVMLRQFGIRAVTFEPVTPQDVAAADEADANGTEAGL